MKFDAIAALTSQHGFELKSEKYGPDPARITLTKGYEKTEDVAWHGPMRFAMTVRVLVGRDGETLHVSYYAGDRRIKEKTHLNDKRAYNAIRETLANNGFEI